MRPIHFERGEKIPNTLLSYIKEAPRKDPKRRRALFLCDCGNQIETDLNWVRFLNVTSCGCYKKQTMIAKNTKHGHASRIKKSGAYKSWQAMHQRTKSHPLYVNRYVCDLWSGENGFSNFYFDMGKRPKGMSIERIDNEGIYEPSNCKWATSKEQSLNKSNSRRKV